MSALLEAYPFLGCDAFGGGITYRPINGEGANTTEKAQELAFGKVVPTADRGSIPLATRTKSRLMTRDMNIRLE
jgi:hypothetical protein